MHLPSFIRTTLPALLFAGLLGCGSSGTGAMNVHLVDGPGDYDHVTLQVKRLDIHGPNGWETLADFSASANGAKQVDLLSLVGGVKETLVDGKALSAGHYDQMRLLLGSGNTVTLKGASTAVPLKVPSGMQSGVKFPVSFDVEPNTTRDVFIDFDAHRSIFVHAAGASDQYLLRPVVRAVDRLVTGAITGTVVDTLGAPIPSVEVYAEAIGGDGRPGIVRTVTTSSTGAYVLDLLPANATYYVVTQPVAATAAYSATASAAIAINEAAATPTFDAVVALVPAAQLGAVGGVITPAAVSPDADEVAIQKVFAGTKLIVRSVNATVDVGGIEAYAALSLPADVYSLSVTRGTIDSDGNQVVTARSAADTSVTIPASVLPVTQNLTIP